MILTNPIEDLVIVLQTEIFIPFEKKGFKNNLLKIKDSDLYSKSHQIKPLILML